MFIYVSLQRHKKKSFFESIANLHRSLTESCVNFWFGLKTYIFVLENNRYQLLLSTNVESVHFLI